MPVGPGSRFGPYEITALLGEGSMGKVWRAHHTGLKRDDALKVLPDAFASDPERLARFQREAQVLASLNHPNIAHVYGLERADGVQALVMELVEGPTLADRIAQGSIPVDEALLIAKQIAEALEAAHEQGIIHRDLKPANIKVRPDGTVKVLDFGLAKALQPSSAAGSVDVTASPTITSPTMTQMGVILGTAAYMSPEQARGKAVDKRSDIWAFGCVLYEMLTGRRAFTGDTVSDVIAGILTKDPDWQALSSSTPPGIRAVLLRCLQRDPHRRLPHVGVVRLDIDDVHASSTPLSDGRQRRMIPMVAAAFVAGLALATAPQFFVEETAEQGSAFLAAVEPPAGETFDALVPDGFMAVSPDGSRLAYVARDQSGISRIWIRALDSAAPQRLNGTEGASYPFWSPDSRSIAFFAEGRLLRTDVSGASVSTIAMDALPAGGAWNRQGVILFRTRASPTLSQVSSTGGTPVPATRLDESNGETSHAFPYFLPDDTHFLYSAIGGTPGSRIRTATGLQPRGTFVGSIESQDRIRVLDEGVNVQYAAGHLIFLKGTALMAQRFDAARRELTDNPHEIASGIAIGGFRGSSGAFSVSAAGVLAYQTGAPALSQLTWFSRDGVELGTLGSPAEFTTVELSPDRRRALAVIVDSETRTRDIWMFDDLKRGVPTRLTFADSDEASVVWSPDGRWIAYDTAREGSFDMYRKSATGSDPDVPMATTPLNERPFSWSSDGRYVIYEAGSLESPNTPFGDIWVIPVDGGRKPFPFVATEFSEVRPKFSPDGRFVTYESTESGRVEVYVARFPDASAKIRVSQDGGSWARWSQEGSEIFYLAADNTLMSVPVKASDVIQVGTPRPLFKTRAKRVMFSYDVTEDAQRFLINSVPKDAGQTPITLVVNWPRLLTR